MKKTIKLFIVLNLFLSSVLVYSQGSLQDIVGAKGSDCEYQMQDRGYILKNTSKSNSSVYQNWYNQTKAKCVTVWLENNRVKSIVNSPNDCGKTNNNNNNNGNRYGSSNGNNNYNNNNNNNNYKSGSGSGNVDNLVGEDAKYAYEQFSKKGYYNTKTVKDGANTYKLWKKDDKCKKTTSRDGKITSITNSTNCK